MEIRIAMAKNTNGDTNKHLMRDQTTAENCHDKLMQK